MMPSTNVSYDVPTPDYHPPLAFLIVYYGVFMPVAYIGNLLTLVVSMRVQMARKSNPDVLVAGLALNDFLTCAVFFTPSLVAEVRGRWFGETFCQFHAVAVVWYLYTTFGILVLMSIERWLAIVKPFYHQTHVTPFRLKAAVTFVGAFCLLLGGLPLSFYPAALMPGWYCTIGECEGPPVVFWSISLSFIVLGIVLLVGFTGYLIVYLVTKPTLYVSPSRAESKFAKVMAVVGAFFILTWLPSAVTLEICLLSKVGSQQICHAGRFWASRIVNMAVAINPIIYGILKRTYRHGYWYIARLVAHYGTCKLLPRPTGGAEIFDGRSMTPVSPYPSVKREDTDPQKATDTDV